jgi:hypothetical protein
LDRNHKQDYFFFRKTAVLFSRLDPFDPSGVTQAMNTVGRWTGVSPGSKIQNCRSLSISTTETKTNQSLLNIEGVILESVILGKKVRLGALAD